MSIRSKWCDVDKETRKYLKKRDKEQCIICGKKGALQAMHIFLSRAKGGRGSKENCAEGCIDCHRIIDNPIGVEELKKSQAYLQQAKTYLIEKEGIVVNKEFLDSLRYKKTFDRFLLNIPEKLPTTKELARVGSLMVNGLKTGLNNTRCQNCRFIRKNKFNNSSIPSYFCVANKKVVGKKNIACNKFKLGGKNEFDEIR